MKRIWLPFLIAFFVCTGKVNAAPQEGRLVLEAALPPAPDVSKNTFTETDARRHAAPPKILDIVKNGFYKENGKRRYYKNGKLHTGFLTLDGKKYYFDGKGNMVTGDKKIKKACYYFGPDGVMQTGFVEKEDKGFKIKTYYGSNGRLKTGTFRVGTVQYQASPETGGIYSIKNLADTICQRPDLPTGCEITSWAMMANYAGIDIGKTEAADKMPTSADPNQGFVGSPYSSEGGSLVIYPGGLKGMTEEYFDSYEDMTNCTYEQIEEKLWEKHLVLAWVTRLDGFGSHTVALTGYDQEKLYYNDPWTGEESTIDREYFETIWAENSHMAMSY